MTSANKPVSGEGRRPGRNDPSAVAPGSTDGKLFIIGLRCGRLGNRLILFANLIAYAAEHGDRVANVTFHSYAHLFETTRRHLLPVSDCGPAGRMPGVASAIRNAPDLCENVAGSPGDGLKLEPHEAR